MTTVFVAFLFQDSISTFSLTSSPPPPHLLPTTASTTVRTTERNGKGPEAVISASLRASDVFVGRRLHPEAGVLCARRRTSLVLVSPQSSFFCCSGARAPTIHSFSKRLYRFTVAESPNSTPSLPPFASTHRPSPGGRKRSSAGIERSSTSEFMYPPREAARRGDLPWSQGLVSAFQTLTTSTRLSFPLLPTSRHFNPDPSNPSAPSALSRPPYNSSKSLPAQLQLQSDTAKRPRLSNASSTSSKDKGKGRERRRSGEMGSKDQRIAEMQRSLVELMKAVEEAIEDDVSFVSPSFRFLDVSRRPWSTTRRKIIMTDRSRSSLPP